MRIEKIEKTYHIDELLYYIMLLLFMGSKALGLSEGQWPFSVALFLGSFVFLVKLFITKYTIKEWLLNAFLMLIGIIVILRNGHIELLLLSMLIIGMKNVIMKRALRVSLMIWGSIFCFTVIRALMGIYPGVISTQKKFGMNYGIVRYSLGFTHPNVLHITYFIISLMFLYIANRSIRRILITSIFLSIGNVYIFAYSMSYTGFLVVFAAIFLNLFFYYRKELFAFEKAAILIFIASCFLLPIIGQKIFPSNIADTINQLVNGRLKLADEVFSSFSPSLFGNADDLGAVNLNLDCSYAYILFYQGIIPFMLFVVSFICSIVWLIKKNDKSGIALLLSMALSGVTEQYMGNLSFKNVSVLFIGDYLYNRNGILNNSKEVNFSKIFSYINRIKRYFRGTPYLKCILPASLVAVVALVIFNTNYVEPKHIYYVDADKIGTLEYNYSEFVADELEISNSIIVGELYDGCRLSEEAWVDFRLETIRSRMSLLLWSFVIGFIFFAYIFNIKKLNTVYIEDAVKQLNDAEELPYMPRCSLLGTNISVTNMSATLKYIQENMDKLRRKYICVSNVHTTVTAFEDEKYRDIQNSAAMTLPDGKPLSYVSRKRGYFQAERVAGPDLMEEIFKISVKKGYKHFFFGSTQDTLVKLKQQLEKKYPGINIVGMLSPNYYKTVDDIPNSEDLMHIKTIQDASPDFIWIGLGAPKQEIWMARHEGMFEGVMLGVGAGFDFHAGTIKRAPKIFQALYLEWLYRIFQDPKRLVKRYLSTNFKFINNIYKEGKVIKGGDIASDKKRILIYAHYYSPDVASTGQILTELAEGLCDSFDVTVISVVPSYNGVVDERYKAYRYYQQNVRGVEVYRIRVPEFTKSKKISRAKNILSYYVRAKKLTLKVGKQDYVFAISQPPILGGMLGVYGKRIKKAKFIYNIQDFNPEQIQTVGYSQNKLLINTLKYIDKRSCSKSDMIVTVGEDLAQTIKRRFENQKVPSYCVINNWIDEKEVYPLANSEKHVMEFKKKYGIADKFVFMYSGNLGLYYDLENLLKVIEKIPRGLKSLDDREVVFAFVGDGGVKQKLQKYVQEKNMHNVIFIPYQDKSELIYSLNASDVHICINAKGIKGVSCPSKYYGIAAVGKPVLGILEPETEIRNIIEKTQSGFVYMPGDYKGIFEAILVMAEKLDAVQLNQMGERGRDYLVDNLTKNISIKKYIELINSLN